MILSINGETVVDKSFIQTKDILKNASRPIVLEVTMEIPDVFKAFPEREATDSAFSLMQSEAKVLNDSDSDSGLKRNTSHPSAFRHVYPGENAGYSKGNSSIIPSSAMEEENTEAVRGFAFRGAKDKVLYVANADIITAYIGGHASSEQESIIFIEPVDSNGKKHEVGACVEVKLCL